MVMKINILLKRPAAQQINAQCINTTPLSILVVNIEGLNKTKKKTLRLILDTALKFQSNELYNLRQSKTSAQLADTFLTTQQLCERIGVSKRPCLRWRKRVL